MMAAASAWRRLAEGDQFCFEATFVKVNESVQGGAIVANVRAEPDRHGNLQFGYN